MPLKGSLAVVIPALNEAMNLAATVETVRRTIPDFFQDWEILVFNDGSTDRTGAIADRLARHDPHIAVIHHDSPRNLGACYREGISRARADYLILVPGDNECGEEVLRRVFAQAGKADIIIPYTANLHVRPLGRQILSRAFVHMMNFLSGQRLRYYNGAVLHKTALLKKCPNETNSFGYQAEILVKLLRRGHSYLEVPIDITYRTQGRSKALHWRNAWQVARLVAGLCFSQREARG